MYYKQLNQGPNESRLPKFRLKHENEQNMTIIIGPAFL